MVDKIKTVCTAFVALVVYLILFRTLLHFMYGIPIIIGDGEVKRVDITFSQFVTGIVVAPLWEELIFRVAPIRIAKAVNPQALWPVVFISAAIFGWGHGGLTGLMFQGVMGVVFSYVYIKTEYNYWSAVILHAMWNTFVGFMF